ncbi:MAG TPA: hypothetical protein VMX97_13365 [Hyphomicrobiaceae bacterium]|nr:hypothetical protein [Hyphomicrobiaceae bacterium]
MTKKPENKDPDFGAKLDHLAGILGHRYRSQKFQQKRLADELETNAATFSRMRIG